LNPIKPKLILDQVVEETGFPQSVVRCVVNAFYSELHESMSKISSVNINVNGLGTFSIKRNALNRRIEDTKKMVGFLEKKRNDFVKSEIVYQDKLKDLNILENAFEMVEKEKQAKACSVEEKHKYYNEKLSSDAKDHF
jgi:nucleoid DNA-binding protein